MPRACVLVPVLAHEPPSRLGRLVACQRTVDECAGGAEIRRRGPAAALDLRRASGPCRARPARASSERRRRSPDASRTSSRAAVRPSRSASTSASRSADEPARVGRGSPASARRPPRGLERTRERRNGAPRRARARRRARPTPPASRRAPARARAAERPDEHGRLRPPELARLPAPTSQPTGFRLCGIADEPPASPASRTSPTSVCASSCDVERDLARRPPAMIASAAPSSATRTRFACHGSVGSASPSSRGEERRDLERPGRRAPPASRPRRRAAPARRSPRAREGARRRRARRRATRRP